MLSRHELCKYLVDFGELIQWFENKENSKEQIELKMLDLKAFQSVLCPCELHNKYGPYTLSTYDIDRILIMMKCANLHSPYIAKGTTFTRDDSTTHLPPVHVFNCACSCTSTIISQAENSRNICEYKRFLTSQ